MLLDKPLGWSSNQALGRVRRLYGGVKGGHSGALDPLATGMLPCCLGEATKIAGLMLGERKAYTAEVALGRTTTTDDAEGEVTIELPVPDMSDALIEAALAPFRGEIQQRAPIYSALKQGGVPLYRRARRGEDVTAPVRGVRIEALTLMAHGADRLTLEIVCGSGTYIRSLARDIGEALGCGAHLSALRRTWVAPFEGAAMVTLDALEAAAERGDAALSALRLPLAAGLQNLPAITLDAGAALRFRRGQTVEPGAASTVAPGQCAVFDAGGAAIGLGLYTENAGVKPSRVFNEI